MKEFILQNFEKSIRLSNILEAFMQDPYFISQFVLKGGAALHLPQTDASRLFFDLDFDLCISASEEEIKEKRDEYRRYFISFVTHYGYTYSTKSRFSFSVDSLCFQYYTEKGNIDYLKIEINYSLREHILTPVLHKVQNLDFPNLRQVKTLDMYELLAIKLQILIQRERPKDLFDIQILLSNLSINAAQFKLIQEMIVFYYSITASSVHMLTLSKIEEIDYLSVKKELIPLLRKNSNFNFQYAKQGVKEFVSTILNLSSNEIEYLNQFYYGNYFPNLLFNDSDILSRLNKHPVALWKEEIKQRILKKED